MTNRIPATTNSTSYLEGISSKLTTYQVVRKFLELNQIKIDVRYTCL